MSQVGTWFWIWLDDMFCWRCCIYLQMICIYIRAIARSSNDDVYLDWLMWNIAGIYYVKYCRNLLFEFFTWIYYLKYCRNLFFEICLSFNYLKSIFEIHDEILKICFVEYIIYLFKWFVFISALSRDLQIILPTGQWSKPILINFILMYIDIYIRGVPC